MENYNCYDSEFVFMCIIDFEFKIGRRPRKINNNYLDEDECMIYELFCSPHFLSNKWDGNFW